MGTVSPAVDLGCPGELVLKMLHYKELDNKLGRMKVTQVSTEKAPIWFSDY